MSDWMTLAMAVLLGGCFGLLAEDVAHMRRIMAWRSRATRRLLADIRAGRWPVGE